jgi:glycosyltransferase involved in cell wall biosynthesis
MKSLDIDIYCGPSHEQWSPKSLDKGLGGSEAMVIGLAKELAKKNKVHVWCRCLDDEGTYDGVVYKNYDEFNIRETDVLIIWRTPSLLLKHHLDKVKAEKYLWLHDTIMQLDVLPYTLIYDGIFCVSQWHKEYYTIMVPPELRKRYIETRNAVDYSLFDQKVKRDPKTMVYGSLYNRGLVHLLTAWPKIKLAVPDAKLRIFYGWETLEKILPLIEFKKFKKEVEELMDQEGITHLGRISHEEVIKEMLGAGIWAYPCIDFNEVSCITAMNAQIAGAIPVVIPKAALNETVKYGKKISKGQTAGDIIDKWSDELINVLNDERGQEQFRRVMMKFSKKIWDFPSLAKSWMKEFNAK